MTHRQIENALGRLIATDTDGNATGLTLDEARTLEELRDGWRRLVAHREALGRIRRSLVADRVAAGLVEA